jgi:hypothetical protein
MPRSRTRYKRISAFRPESQPRVRDRDTLTGEQHNQLAAVEARRAALFRHLTPKERVAFIAQLFEPDMPDPYITYGHAYTRTPEETQALIEGDRAATAAWAAASRTEAELRARFEAARAEARTWAEEVARRVTQEHMEDAQ